MGWTSGFINAHPNQSLYQDTKTHKEPKSSLFTYGKMALFSRSTKYGSAILSTWMFSEVCLSRLLVFSWSIKWRPDWYTGKIPPQFTVVLKIKHKNRQIKEDPDQIEIKSQKLYNLQ